MNHEELERNFDRLVDGELTVAARRELLSRLDDMPDGWRRCALAFLEAQAWSHDLPRLAGEAPVPAELGPASGTRWVWTKTIPTALAMAASFLLAFVLGLALRSNTTQRNQLAEVALPPPASSSAVVPQPQSDRAATATTALVSRRSRPEVETIWLPASTTDESDPYATLPDDLARDLARQGHAIERRQELWPVQLEDGRRAVLPIDRLDVRYVGYEYQ
jgi:hypothetical protein